jgi:hypothetical protein
MIWLTGFSLSHSLIVCSHFTFTRFTPEFTHVDRGITVDLTGMGIELAVFGSYFGFGDESLASVGC